MLFSSNETIILNILNFGEHISAKYLADQLYVSTKTIYRLVKKINDMSQIEFGENIIFSEPGKGYILNSFFINKHIHSVFNFNEENTWNEIVLSILFSHPKKRNHSIFKNEYLSESSFERRLRETEVHLQKYDIKLINENGYLSLEGTEVNIRKAINALLAEITKNKNLNDIGLEITKRDKYFLDSQLNLIETYLGENIIYPYDITIMTHLFMIIKRYREGAVSYLNSQTPLEKEEQSLMLSCVEITNVSQKVIKNMSDYLAIAINDLEVYFLFQNIYSSNLKKRDSNTHDKKIAQVITENIITEFYGISDISILPMSRTLYEDLYHHIEPMVNRLRLGISIENVLLEEVMLEYESIFKKLTQIVARINEELSFDTKISVNEIGYLTLYFAKYNIKKTMSKRVLLVCSTGIGTSELLKVKINNKYPSLNIVSTMSQRQVKNNLDFILENVDLIFTTIKLTENMGEIPVLNISPLLLDKDIQNINYTLGGT